MVATGFQGNNLLVNADDEGLPVGGVGSAECFPAEGRGCGKAVDPKGGRRPFRKAESSRLSTPEHRP